MFARNQKLGLVVTGLLGFAGISPLFAELPGLSEKEWLGHFVGFQNKKVRFGITTQGKATIKILGEDSEPLNQRLAIPVEFLVEEVMPDGKITAKSIKPETLESAQPATNKPENMVIRGKVTGDASFEAFVNEDRGVISLGGRLLDRGNLTRNPVRFLLRLKFPNAYPSAKTDGDKDKEKELKDKMKNDRLQLTWSDGKRVKQAVDKAVDAGSQEINGPGIAAMQVEFTTYDEKKLEIIASENSSMRLSNTQSAPLNEGFMLTWMVDPAKDPEGKARLSFEVK